MGDPQQLRRWLESVDSLGFGVLVGVPVESGEVARVAEGFGYVRETNYGRLFDVRVEGAPTNLAFTGLAIAPHTDNPYRDPVPTVQLLHCLANAVDGRRVRAGRRLPDGRAARGGPRTYEILTRTPVMLPFSDRDSAS